MWPLSYYNHAHSILRNKLHCHKNAVSKLASKRATEQTKTVLPHWNSHYFTLIQVINKGYFSEAFLFKPRGGRSPPSSLNRKPRKYPLFCLSYGAGANKHVTPQFALLLLAWFPSSHTVPVVGDM